MITAENSVSDCDHTV